MKQRWHFYEPDEGGRVCPIVQIFCSVCELRVEQVLPSRLGPMWVSILPYSPPVADTGKRRTTWSVQPTYLDEAFPTKESTLKAKCRRHSAVEVPVAEVRQLVKMALREGRCIRRLIQPGGRSLL